MTSEESAAKGARGCARSGLPWQCRVRRSRRGWPGPVRRRSARLRADSRARPAVPAGTPPVLERNAEAGALGERRARLSDLARALDEVLDGSDVSRSRAPVRGRFGRFFVERIRCSALPALYARAAVAGTSPGFDCVFLGVGSLTSVLSVAQSGIQVTVLEESRVLCACARAVAAANGLGGAVRVLRVPHEEGGLAAEAPYAGLAARVHRDGRPFALVCERLCEDLLGERLLQTVACAKRGLGGAALVVPREVELWAAPLELRFADRPDGFSLEPLDGLRPGGSWVPVRLDRQPGHRCLLAAEPQRVLVADLERDPRGVWISGRCGVARWVATARARVNALASWFRVRTAGGDATSAPLLCGQVGGEATGMKQAVHYLPTPLDVQPGAVFAMRWQLTALADGLCWSLDDGCEPARPTDDPWGRGGLQALPILGYHFAMVADPTRNAAFAAGLAAAIDQARARAGGRRRPRVLDVGAGAGLLSLHAARLGAEVVAAEMVPRLRGVAAEVLAANGVGGGVELLPAGPSTALQPEACGGPFDVAVAEVFDAGLLGEGAVPSLRHAASLLRPGGQLVPAGATVMLQPAEFWPLGGLGWDLGELHRALFAGSGGRSLRLSTLPHRLLGPAVEALQVDFAALPEPSRVGRSAEVELPVSRPGCLTALVWWFELQFPGGGVLSSGADGRQRTWKQLAVFLAAPYDVGVGETVPALVSCDDLRVIVRCRA